MILTKTHLFVILLLTLVFCSLFGNCTNLEGYDVKSWRQNRETGNTTNKYNYSKLYDESTYSNYLNNLGQAEREKWWSQKLSDPNNIHLKKNEKTHLPKNHNMYVLKSKIVPPVCPVCPAVVNCNKKADKCPPCPPCARCPEPAFECKKVPNYNSVNNEILPVPLLNSFSQFGL